MKAEVQPVQPEPEWVDTSEAERTAEQLRKIFPLPCRPGGELDEP